MCLWFVDTHNIDTRTFTRPKKSNRKINDALQNGSHISDSDIDFSKTYTVNKLSSEFSKLRRTNPDEYLSNGDGPRSRMAYNNGRDDSGGPALSRRSAKMEDVNDVHLLAKMQEESE